MCNAYNDSGLEEINKENSLIMKKFVFILIFVLSICIVGCSNNDSSSLIPDSNKVYKYGLTFIQYKAYLYWFGFIDNGDAEFMKEDDSFPTENNERTEYIVKNFNNTFFMKNHYQLKEHEIICLCFKSMVLQKKHH